MYQRILVPIDGSPTSNRGLDEAIRLARLTGGQLRLMHVVDDLAVAISNPQGVYAADLFALLQRGGEDMLLAASARVKDAGVAVDTVLADTMKGRLCNLVADEAASWGADLIVIGTHGRRGVGRVVMGSDAEQILRLAPVPVLLVRAAPAAA